MARMGRPGLSDAQKAELWRRWKQGQSLSEIGRALGKHPASVHGVARATGGFPPLERRRADRALCMTEREEISRGVAGGESLRSITARIGRAPSTVSREIVRNGGGRRYRAADAEDAAWKRACRPKPCRLATNRFLRTIVARKLMTDWSPQQISEWLMLEFPGDPSMHVSHETIYRSLFIQARGVLKRELLSHLRSRRMMRRSRYATTKVSSDPNSSALGEPQSLRTGSLRDLLS